MKKEEASLNFIKNYKKPINTRKSTSFELVNLKDKQIKNNYENERNLHSSHQRKKKQPEEQPEQTKQILKGLKSLLKKKSKREKIKIEEKKQNNSKFSVNTQWKLKEIIQKNKSNLKIKPNSSPLKEKKLNKNFSTIDFQKKQIHYRKKIKIIKNVEKIQKNPKEKKFKDEEEKMKEDLSQIDFSILVTKEEFLYNFLVAFYKEQDFYNIFQEYIDFFQEKDFSQFIRILPEKNKKQFKNSMILDLATLLLSFLLLLNKQFSNEQIFFKKLILSIYSSHFYLIQKFQDLYGSFDFFKNFQNQFEKINLRSFDGLEIKLHPKISANNQKIFKYIQSQKTQLDSQISHSLIKICEFIDDFSVDEGFKYLLDIFSKVFKEIGVTPENNKNSYQISYVGLEQINENSSERSSSVNSESIKKEYILVLDLDETLVHYSEEDGEGKVYFRPYVDQFLKEMSKYYEIMIFTASLKEYADPILDTLDQEKQIISKRFYRQDTLFVNQEYSIKDLQKLNRDLSKVIIIDNIPENFKNQPENGIFINSWFKDPNDAALKNLIPILKDLVKSETNDVREYLKKCKQQLIQKIERGSLNPSIFLQIIVQNQYGRIIEKFVIKKYRFERVSLHVVEKGNLITIFSSF